MTEYVALLRGINVGATRIAMADLRAEFEALGLREVSTVLATGNVRFASDRTDVADLRAEIEAALSARFDYRAYVFLHPRDAIRAALDGYPFPANQPDRHSYVVFVAEDDVRAELLEAAADLDAAVERVADGHGVLYWEVVKKMTLTSPFGKALGRARYKATTTNRNLRTVRSIIA
ncbi:DUF1697 domain-containing protein [Williamsia maris]|uniref:Uncharacterized conserved protein, DUF1697 family n=1 Tax=Williamsia maris TaxID=72806 RepID=A0ABT1HFL6_9NOCA|nr:DUF1697 domain-containing protein [Williamsia maris]MCP2177037.1 Uncharacterized conserved protein, DUF1697 family [Williamsia maris]